MIIRLFCTKHQCVLDAFDSGPQLVPVEREEPRQGSYQAKDGRWEVDLSDVGCPQEITEWYPVWVEDDGAWGVEGNHEGTLLKGRYSSEKDAQRVADGLELDECSPVWTLTLISQ